MKKFNKWVKILTPKERKLLFYSLISIKDFGWLFKRSIQSPSQIFVLQF
jgi:hypothetical protein